MGGRGWRQGAVAVADAGSCIANYSVHQLLSSNKLDLHSGKRCQGARVQPLPLAVKIC